MAPMKLSPSLAGLLRRPGVFPLRRSGQAAWRCFTNTSSAADGLSSSPPGTAGSQVLPNDLPSQSRRPPIQGLNSGPFAGVSAFPTQSVTVPPPTSSLGPPRGSTFANTQSWPDLSPPDSASPRHPSLPIEIRLPRRAELPRIPKPIPFVPDVKSFLMLIGRGMQKHASKFPSWEALFSLTSEQLANVGVNPARDRRYLLLWLDKFRNGEFGPGGNLKYVMDGVAYLRVKRHYVEKNAFDGVNRTYAGTKRQNVVVNVPDKDTDPNDMDIKDCYMPSGYTANFNGVISGPFLRRQRGTGRGKVEISEGMWEIKQGRKIDGGERRQAEIRFKRGVEERRAQREALGFH